MGPSQGRRPGVSPFDTTLAVRRLAPQSWHLGPDVSREAFSARPRPLPMPSRLVGRRGSGPTRRIPVSVILMSRDEEESKTRRSHPVSNRISARPIGFFDAFILSGVGGIKNDIQLLLVSDTAACQGCKRKRAHTCRRRTILTRLRRAGHREGRTACNKDLTITQHTRNMDGS